VSAIGSGCPSGITSPSRQPHRTPEPWVPGTHVRLRFTTVPELDAAARILTDSTRDDEALTLRVPSDGGTKSLRALLDRLDEYSISAEGFSVHTPDLDDVFLALTGHTTEVVAK
jgi:ABC-2 type transport system ATP-binding protein